MPEHIPDNALLSERQAAKMLGLSVDALRQEVNTGRLGFVGPRASPKRKYVYGELQRWKRAKDRKEQGPDLTGVPRSQRQVARAVARSGLSYPR